MPCHEFNFLPEIVHVNLTNSKNLGLTLFTPFTWYEGKKPDGKPYLPEFPASIDLAEAFPKGVSAGGWMIIGTDGVILNKNDQAKDMELWPKKRREEFPADKIPKTEIRSTTPGNPQQEWTEAIKRGKEFPGAGHFDYSCPLTEATLIGGLAMRFPGKRLKWDSKALKFDNEAANKFIKRAAYRKGWEYSADKV